MERLIKQFVNIGVIKFGDFKLKSGIISPIYIDLRVLVGYPKIIEGVISCLNFRVLPSESEIDFDLIAGIPYTALPLACHLSIVSGKPMIYSRKEKKGYGTNKQIEGVYKPGQTVLILDDLITNGDSKFETLAIFEAEGLTVKDIVVIIDREQGGGDKLKEKGYTLHSLFTLMEILDYCLENGITNIKKYGEVVNFLEENRKIKSSIPEEDSENQLPEIKPDIQEVVKRENSLFISNPEKILDTSNKSLNDLEKTNGESQIGEYKITGNFTYLCMVGNILYGDFTTFELNGYTLFEQFRVNKEEIHTIIFEKDRMKIDGQVVLYGDEDPLLDEFYKTLINKNTICQGVNKIESPRRLP